MTTLLNGIARSPWRVGVTFDAVWSGMATAANYTFARQDGVGTTVSVNVAFNTDPLGVDLALTEALDVGIVYVVTATGVAGSALVSYVVAPQQPVGAVVEDDPEAEAFGVDIDWMADAPDGGGDAPEIRGIACLQADLPAIARTVPGELFHRPQAGAGLPTQVNGPGGNADDLGARVRSEWLKDPRVQDASCPTLIDTTGGVTIAGSVAPIALDDSIPVQVA